MRTMRLWLLIIFKSNPAAGYNHMEIPTPSPVHDPQYRALYGWWQLLKYYFILDADAVYIITSHELFI